MAKKRPYKYLQDRLPSGDESSAGFNVQIEGGTLQFVATSIPGSYFVNLIIPGKKPKYFGLLGLPITLK